MDERTVFGHIKYQGEDFMIHSMEESNTSLIFKQGKNSSSTTGSGCGASDHFKVEKAPIQDDPASNGRLGATANCDIRVLVYFTPRANNTAANITQVALTAIAETNIAFRNSNISPNTISLVSAGVEFLSPLPTGWTEDILAIPANFSEDANSLADEPFVKNRRVATGADIVVCLTGDVYPNGSGSIALPGGFTLPARAYAVVETTDAISNISFAHEVGHFLDCRHAHQDLTGMPYARGHFYQGNNNTIYRTIMGRNVQGTATTRIPYFSNPSVSYKGAPTGNTLRDNARRIRERACAVANHENSENNPLSAVIQGTTTAYTGSYHTFRADVSGGGPGVYSYEWRVSSSPIPNGSILSTNTQLGTQLAISLYSADKYIHLRVTSADGQVRNVVHSVYVWGGIGPPPPNRLGESSNLGVYPNPANSKVTLSLESAETGQAKVLLYNALGKVVREESFYHQSGSMQYKYNISDLTAGVYLVSVQIGDQKFTKKLVKAN
ncbi:MAG: zinc-dependent metalloprotease [Bacteroidia bacterium]